MSLHTNFELITFALAVVINSLQLILCVIFLLIMCSKEITAYCSWIQVVELTKDEKTQADALSVVLSLQYVSAFHARAMAEESGFALLKRILLSSECKIGYHTLKV